MRCHALCADKAMYYPGGHGNTTLLVASLVVGNIGGTMMAVPPL